MQRNEDFECSMYVSVMTKSSHMNQSVAAIEYAYGK